MALISNPENAVSPLGVLAIAIVFTLIVWVLAGVRFWALRNFTYRTFSPKWISNVAVMLIVVMVTVSLGLLFFAYYSVFRMRDLQSAWIAWDDKRYLPGIMDSQLATIDHKQDVILEWLNKLELDIMKSSLAWRLSSTTTLWLIKFSIVMIYLELLESLTKGIRFLVHLTIWTIVLTYVATVTLFCIGMPSDDWGQNKSSDIPVVTEYTYGAANVITDFQILTIALWSLHIIKVPQSRGYAITTILFMGFVTISLALIRAILYDIHIRKKIEFDQSVDIIGLVEPLVASWLACLPALRVLFRLRRRSRAVELEARLRELRSPGHERMGSDLHQVDTSQIGRALGGEGIDAGCGAGDRGIISPLVYHLRSHNAPTAVGGRISNCGSDEDMARGIEMENRDSVRPSSFTGSDRSAQVGEWKRGASDDMPSGNENGGEPEMGGFFGEEVPGGVGDLRRIVLRP